MRTLTLATVAAIALAAACAAGPAPANHDSAFDTGLLAGGIPSDRWDTARATVLGLCDDLDLTRPPAATIDTRRQVLTDAGLDGDTATTVLQLGASVYCPDRADILQAWAAGRR